MLACAMEGEADLIALALAQHLTPGRATVVREAMANPTLPVLLLPDIDPGHRERRDADPPEPVRGR